MRGWVGLLAPIAAMLDLIRHPEHVYTVAGFVERLVR
jgi:hypothetical protein